MDKLKLISDFFKKYLFWFLSAATIILVLVCWWMSTASLAKSFQQQQARIKKKFDEVKAISDDQQHPTPDYIKAVNDKHQKLKEGVLGVWKTLYDEQMKKNPWPAILGDKFIEKVGKLGPTDTIPYDLREQYQNAINKYFPVLYNIIDLRHPSDAAEGGGKGGDNAVPAYRPIMGIRIPQIGHRPTAAPTESADWEGTVDWDENDRLRLEERFNWKTRPDSDVIRFRQEDLWVYETLLRVIRETNREEEAKKDEKGNIVINLVNIKDHSLANVKRIEWIEIGADAIGAWSTADQSVFKASPAEAAAGAASHDVRTAPAGRSGDTGAAQDSKEQLLKDRYVDDKGTPLDADAKQPYSEFKMMPISMKLHMDQRKISKLLAECVNSPMPIEVRRVRIRPGMGEILDSATAGAGTASPTGPGRDYTKRVIDAHGPTRPAGGGGGADEGETGPYDIPVEIQGIIYIYNKYDENTLGTGTAAEKPAVGTLPGAAPAEAGAPGATAEPAPAKPADTTPSTPAPTAPATP